MHGNISRGLLSVFALIFGAFLCAGAMGADIWYYEADLDPYIDEGDYQIIATGQGGPNDSYGWPSSVLTVSRYGSGSCLMWRDIPHLTSTSTYGQMWLKGQFDIKVRSWDAESTNGSTVYQISTGNSSKIRLGAVHSTESTWKLGFHVINDTGGYEVNQLLNYSATTGTTYTVKYEFECAHWRPSRDTVKVYLYEGAVLKVSYTGYAKKTRFGSDWQQIWHGIGGAGDIEHTVTLSNASVTASDNGGGSDAIISPTMNGRWLIASSLDPSGTTGLNEEGDGDGNVDVAVLTSGLRSGTVCNYGMSAEIESADNETYARFNVPLPALGLNPNGPGSPITADIVLEGKLYLKLDSADDIEDGDETIVHALYGGSDPNDTSGIRFKVLHDGSGGGKLRVEVGSVSDGEFGVDGYVESTSQTWTDWQYIYYELTRHHDGSGDWDDYTLDVWIDATSGSPLCTLTDTYTYGGSLRRATYGIQLDGDDPRDEKWYFDDAYVTGGVFDVEP